MTYQNNVMILSVYVSDIHTTKIDHNQKKALFSKLNKAEI
jgi:hypothetical protein